MIELRAISEDNFRECLLLRASVENEDFVDPVTYSLAEAWVYYQYRALPPLIHIPSSEMHRQLRS